MMRRGRLASWLFTAVSRCLGASGLVLATLGVMPAAQASFLLPSAEAASRMQLACQPTMILGLMSCESLPEPAPIRGNATEIIPAEFVAPSNEIATMGAQVDETPQAPFLDLVPRRVKAGRFSLSWQNGMGQVGQWWEVWDNQQLRYRGKDFIQRPLPTLSASATDAASSTTQTQSEVVLNDVQGGVFTIEKIEPGEHQWEVRLCNGSQAAPKCSAAYAQTWVESAEQSTESQHVPGQPELAWFPAVVTDGKIMLQWHLYWGKTGDQWQVLNAGKVIYRSSQFTEHTENSQAGRVQLPLVDGVYSLAVRLCQENRCSESRAQTVEAMLGPALAPTPPEVNVYTDSDAELGSGLVAGQVLVSWQTAAASVAPETWRLLDENSRQVIVSQKIKRACQAGVWCGSWQGVPPTRPAHWRVQLCRAQQCVESQRLVVP